MLTSWSPTRKLALLVVLLALVLAIVAGAAGVRSGGDRADDRAEAATDSEASGETLTEADDGTTADGSVANGTGTTKQTTTATTAKTPTTQPLPLAAELSNTKGLRAGDTVRISATAEEGNSLYGVELRLCREGSVIANDGDMRPTVGGMCASKPLSSGADAFLQVQGAPPYQRVDAAFRVGVGTDTFRKASNGETVTITCDARHPCVLAAKFQYENGFGFRTYPLTFAS